MQINALYQQKKLMLSSSRRAKGNFWCLASSRYEHSDFWISFYTFSCINGEVVLTLCCIAVEHNVEYFPIKSNMNETLSVIC